ncbi:MAG: 30S ribosomal protein S2 [Candidatus Micrarchaeota archaeon]
MVDFLVPQEKYLEAGMHIGTRTKNGSMRQFIYKAREDGLHVLDLKKSNERIYNVACFIAKYPIDNFYLVGNKENAKKAIEKFAELTGAKALSSRFTPGRFTNPARNDFVEPQLVMVVDPAVDKQAVKEAFEINVPVIAICDTNNSLKCLDLVIPSNNKGRKSLALVFWILAREVMKQQGKITEDSQYTAAIEDFEA